MATARINSITLPQIVGRNSCHTESNTTKHKTAKIAQPLLKNDNSERNSITDAELDELIEGMLTPKSPKGFLAKRRACFFVSSHIDDNNEGPSSSNETDGYIGCLVKRVKNARAKHFET